MESFYGPNIKAAPYKVLHKSQRVQILYENKQPALIDNDYMTWVFLGNEVGNRYLGWAFKEQLLSERDFTPLTDIKKLSDFSFSRGQMDATVLFYNLGRFQYKWKRRGKWTVFEKVKIVVKLLCRVI